MIKNFNRFCCIDLPLAKQVAYQFLFLSVIATLR
jgi:hypothetical protein